MKSIHLKTMFTPVDPYQRKYLQAQVKYDAWEKLEEFAQELLQQEIKSLEDFEELLYKKNELEIVIDEQRVEHNLSSYRFVEDEKKKQASSQFNKQVLELYDKFKGQLNKKILESSFLSDYINTNPSMLGFR